jgi:hypothetical protein
MSVSSIGMLTSGVCSYILCRATNLFLAEVNVSLSYWVTRILPIGFFMAATLWTGNMVYLYLSVSFIQMLKAFNPIIVMIALFIAGLETPSVRVRAEAAKSQLQAMQHIVVLLNQCQNSRCCHQNMMHSQPPAHVMRHQGVHVSTSPVAALLFTQQHAHALLSLARIAFDLNSTAIVTAAECLFHICRMTTLSMRLLSCLQSA